MLAVTTWVLSEQGYHVLEATNGVDALQLVDAQRGKEDINLLLTDVVMPQIGGKELADRIKEICPGIKVLFTSGYNDDIVNYYVVVAPETDLSGDACLQSLAGPGRLRKTKRSCKAKVLTHQLVGGSR
ncbi:MAG: response regulator [Dehalococcoidia bacterium]